jgi:hypothetical protein
MLSFICACEAQVHTTSEPRACTEPRTLNSRTRSNHSMALIIDLVLSTGNSTSLRGNSSVTTVCGDDSVGVLIVPFSCDTALSVRRSRHGKIGSQVPPTKTRTDAHCARTLSPVGLKVVVGHVFRTEVYMWPCSFLPWNLHPLFALPPSVGGSLVRS